MSATTILYRKVHQRVHGCMFSELYAFTLVQLNFPQITTWVWNQRVSALITTGKAAALKEEGSQRQWGIFPPILKTCIFACGIWQLKFTAWRLFPKCMHPELPSNSTSYYPKCQRQLRLWNLLRHWLLLWVLVNSGGFVVWARKKIRYLTQCSHSSWHLYNWVWESCTCFGMIPGMLSLACSGM